MNFILQFTTGEKFRINQQEAEAIAKAKDDQSITIKRLGMVVQKRMCLVYPEHTADRLEEKKKQQTGILHDGTLVKRHFGSWIFNSGFMPNDDGDYQPIALDREYYPEVALDMVANEDEWKQIKQGNKNYYEFLGINGKVKRLNNHSFAHLLD